MINLIPLPYKLLALGVLAIALFVTGFVAGIKWERPKRDALEQGYKAAAAQAAGREAERIRMWQQAMKVAGEKFNARREQADRSHDAYLDRLRDAYTRSERVRASSPAPEVCARPGGPTAADLLRQGEAIAAIARDADRDRAALMACVEAWPR